MVTGPEHWQGLCPFGSLASPEDTISSCGSKPAQRIQINRKAARQSNGITRKGAARGVEQCNRSPSPRIINYPGGLFDQISLPTIKLKFRLDTLHAIEACKGARKVCHYSYTSPDTLLLYPTEPLAERQSIVSARAS